MPAPLASEYALPAYAQQSPDDQVSFVLPTQSGANGWKFVADGSFVYVIVALVASLTTSAAAGNRTFVFDHLDGNGRAITNTPSSVAQGPGVGVTYSATPAVTSIISAPGAVMMPLPIVPLAPGMTFLAAVSNLDAGDTFAAPVITVLRYSTAPPAQRAPLALVPPPLIA